MYLEEEEVNGFHRNDFFLAQIAMVIAQVNSKDPKDINLAQFLLKFSKDKPKKKPVTKKDVKDHMMKSRMAWSQLLPPGKFIDLNDLLDPSDDADLLEDIEHAGNGFRNTVGAD